MLASHDKKEILLDTIKERAKTLKSMSVMIKEILQTPTSYDEKAVKKGFKGDSIEILNSFGAKLSAKDVLHLPSDYHHLMQEVVQEMEIGFSKIGQPLRIALLGKMGGPGLDVVMAVIGKDETMLRIANAITVHSCATK